METLIQHCNRNVILTTSSRRRYLDFEPTLLQFCIEQKMWTFHGHMVTFPQHCLQVVKNIKGVINHCHKKEEYRCPFENE